MVPDEELLKSNRENVITWEGTFGRTGDCKIDVETAPLFGALERTWQLPHREVADFHAESSDAGRTPASTLDGLEAWEIYHPRPLTRTPEEHIEGEYPACWSRHAELLRLLAGGSHLTETPNEEAKAHAG